MHSPSAFHFTMYIVKRQCSLHYTHALTLDCLHCITLSKLIYFFFEVEKKIKTQLGRPSQDLALLQREVECEFQAPGR